jgi:hypothetical protein
MRWLKRKPVFASWILTICTIVFFFPVRFAVQLGLLFAFGIGDGYPGSTNKIVGACIALPVAAIYLTLVILTFYALLLVTFASTQSMYSKAAHVVGVTLLISGACFTERLYYQTQAIKSAISMGDLDLYERSVRWRLTGSINEDLWFASYFGRIGLVQRLVEKGADVNGRIGGTGSNILDGARQNGRQRTNGNQDVIEYLKQHGAIEVSPLR